MKFISSICGCLVALTAFSAGQKPKEKPAAKHSDGVISGSADKGIVNVHYRIRKADHKTPLQAVYLARRSKTGSGLDLQVPISFREIDDGYSISMLLPFEYSEKTFLLCMHAKPRKEGEAWSSTLAFGETYEIPIQANPPK